MNSQDILLYTVFAIGTLYGLWITVHVVWFGIITLYHYIADEISFYQWKRKR